MSLTIPSGESRSLYTYDASKNLSVCLSGIPGICFTFINLTYSTLYYLTY